MAVRSGTRATRISRTRSKSRAFSPNTSSTPRPSSRGGCHDTIEDTDATREEIEGSFGEQIADLVEGVTTLSKLEIQSEENKQAQNLQKFILAMSKDVRVLIVKLADRLHNMRTLSHIPNPTKRPAHRY